MPVVLEKAGVLDLDHAEEVGVELGASGLAWRGVGRAFHGNGLTTKDLLLQHHREIVSEQDRAWETWHGLPWTYPPRWPASIFTILEALRVDFLNLQEAGRGGAARCE